MRKFVLFTCFLLFSFSVFAGKKYKVTNVDEFNKAVESVNPGDEIIIANGTYSNWETIINTNGTAAKAILIHAETSGKVIFSGDVNKAVFQVTGSYTQIAGLTFTGCNVYKKGGDAGVLIELKNSQNCRITDCLFTKNAVKTQFMPLVIVSGKGHYNRVDNSSFISNVDNQELQVKITADAVPQSTLIDHNIFRDKAKVEWPIYNGGECVQIGQDPVLLGGQYANSIVRENLFIHCNGEPEVISNKSSGNRYIKNYFEDCHGELVMRGGHDCVIDSNTFKGGIGGIRVNGTHHTIVNNVFKGLPIAIRLMYGMAKGKDEVGFYIAASDCMIQHNSIEKCDMGILIGDSKNVDWTGKFDTKRYPSPTIQNVAPFDNKIENNTMVDVKTKIDNKVE